MLALFMALSLRDNLHDLHENHDGLLFTHLPTVTDAMGSVC